MSACILGGLSYDPGFALEVRGVSGAIYVTARPGLSSAAVTIEQVDAGGERRVLTVPAPAAALAGVPAGPASFVAMLYLDLAAAIRRGERTGPDFDHAVRRHRLLDAIRVASADGARQRLMGDAAPVAG